MKIRYKTPVIQRCEQCGAPMAARLEACEHCGARIVTPATQMAELMTTAEDMLPGGGAPLYLLHGSIFVLVGVLFCLTVIGAIVGIPAILIGLGSWRRAWRAHARTRG